MIIDWRGFRIITRLSLRGCCLLLRAERGQRIALGFIRSFLRGSFSFWSIFSINIVVSRSAGSRLCLLTPVRRLRALDCCYSCSSFIIWWLFQNIFVSFSSFCQGRSRIRLYSTRSWSIQLFHSYFPPFFPTFFSKNQIFLSLLM